MWIFITKIYSNITCIIKNNSLKAKTKQTIPKLPLHLSSISNTPAWSFWQEERHGTSQSTWMFTVKMNEVHSGAPSLRNTVPRTPVSPGQIPLWPRRKSTHLGRTWQALHTLAGLLFLLSVRTTLKYSLVLLSELLASAHPAAPPGIALSSSLLLEILRIPSESAWRQPLSLVSIPSPQLRAKGWGPCSGLLRRIYRHTSFYCTSQTLHLLQLGRQKYYNYFITALWNETCNISVVHLYRCYTTVQLSTLLTSLAVFLYPQHLALSTAPLTSIDKKVGSSPKPQHHKLTKLNAWICRTSCRASQWACLSLTSHSLCPDTPVHAGLGLRHPPHIPSPGCGGTGGGQATGPLSCDLLEVKPRRETNTSSEILLNISFNLFMWFITLTFKGWTHFAFLG